MYNEMIAAYFFLKGQLAPYPFCKNREMLKAEVSVFTNEERYSYKRTKDRRAKQLAIFICH